MMMSLIPPTHSVSTHSSSISPHRSISRSAKRNTLLGRKGWTDRCMGTQSAHKLQHSRFQVDHLKLDHVRHLFPFISASSDRTIKAWSPHSPQNALCPTTIGTHHDTLNVWLIAHSRPGMLSKIVRFSENTVGTSIYSLAVTPTGQLLAAGSPAQAIGLYDPRLCNQSSTLCLERCDGQDVGCTHPTLSAHLSTSFNSVWALHSQHPRLEVFHSGDRSGWLCKVDVEGSATFVRVNGHTRHVNNANQGIAKIVALDNAFVWTATGSSTIERWRDIPARIERRQTSSLGEAWQDSLDSSPALNLSDSRPNSSYKLHPRFPTGTTVTLSPIRFVQS
ncbi:hypothetical protein H4Q26_014172 [Puccinia striiformis f. sp. tritici PST-130]|nr:hypothetical protein H4Q26_014172 [Puccinia striiformis f. sp. tritici PST-130]